MIKCVTGKRSYLTQELAEDALIGAHTRFDYLKHQGPVAVYRCSDCGNYHLTSKGPMNARLEKQVSDGSIGRQKQADAWLNKVKHRY